MSEWFKVKPPELKRLGLRELTPVQRSVVSNMLHSVLRSTDRGYLLDTGFEAGVAKVTFYALLRKGLLRSIRGQRTRVYKLSPKGEEWARLPWDPR